MLLVLLKMIGDTACRCWLPCCPWLLVLLKMIGDTAFNGLKQLVRQLLVLSKIRKISEI